MHRLTACRVGLLLLLTALAVPATAQSIEVRDGADAVGFGLYSEFSTSELLTLNGYTAFSIAGTMDVGGYLGRVSETVNGVQGDSMTVGFVYNVIPIRQSESIPISLQLRLTWGLTLVNRDVVVAELQDRLGDLPTEFDLETVDGTRSGYTLGAGISRDFALGGPYWLRLGADVEFRTARSTYSAVFAVGDDDDADAPRVVGFRQTDLLYVPSAALSVRIPDGPVVTFGSRFWFDDGSNVVVRPELNLVWLRYQ